MASSGMLLGGAGIPHLPGPGEGGGQLSPEVVFSSLA